MEQIKEYMFFTFRSATQCAVLTILWVHGKQHRSHTVGYDMKFADCTTKMQTESWLKWIDVNAQKRTIIKVISVAWLVNTGQQSQWEIRIPNQNLITGYLWSQDYDILEPVSTVQTKGPKDHHRRTKTKGFVTMFLSHWSSFVGDDPKLTQCVAGLYSASLYMGKTQGCELLLGEQM